MPASESINPLETVLKGCMVGDNKPLTSGR